jgi:methylglutaconyl-CoA hydratase
MTLNRPQKKNALGKQLLNEFSSHLKNLLHSDCRVLIIRSAVNGVFCAGADLKERQLMTPLQVSQFVHQLRSSFTELEELPMPTISCIDGFALGGGLELALATDLRVCSKDAKLGLPETNLAIIPG